MDDLLAFAKAAAALRPWLAQLVVAGGWAHRLHRSHPLAHPPAHQPVRTLDADLAFSPETPLTGSVYDALTHAGFEEKLLGEQAPPVTHYGLGDEGGGFYVEFLVPLRGDGLTRTGGHDDTLAMAGITAQKMRHLELLLVSPWTIRLPPVPNSALVDEADVLVPNPVSFVAQKLLIHGDRDPRKKAQDVLYVHDTIELFAASRGTLRDLWGETVRPAMAERTARRAVTRGRALFAEVSDTIRDAARIPQDRTLAPENVRAACALGLEAIFAPEDEAD